MPGPVRILNVDDYEPSLYTKSHVLRRAGFDVHEAITGKAALDVVARYSPHLVVLDVKLPDMSGLDVCRTIKERFGEIKVLQTSASFTDVAARVRGLDNGADCYVVEPIDPDEFLANVKALLRIRTAEDALREKECELRRLLAEKELLMREIHHRVKNNMQIVTSLVRLDPAISAQSSQTVQRIMVMATIHDLLYHPDGITRVDMAEHVSKLCDSIVETFSASERIAISYDIEPVTIDTARIMPLALIVNEVVTNALKYAFPDGRHGRLSLKLGRDRDCYVLVITDNGVGMALHENGTVRSKGLGTRLIRNLAIQLDGSVEFAVAGGTRFTLRFPVEPRALA